MVYIHSLDFPLIIYVTKNGQFHISLFWSATGSISPLVVLALWNALVYVHNIVFDAGLIDLCLIPYRQYINHLAAFIKVPNEYVDIIIHCEYFTVNVYHSVSYKPGDWLILVYALSTMCQTFKSSGSNGTKLEMWYKISMIHVYILCLMIKIVNKWSRKCCSNV